MSNLNDQQFRTGFKRGYRELMNDWHDQRKGEYGMFGRVNAVVSAPFVAGAAVINGLAEGFDPTP
jgi:hypothetical protein